MPAVPVPLDVEVQVVYDAYLAEEPDLVPMSLEKLSVIRAGVDVAVAALEDLSHGGRFVVSQPSVPGLDDAPEIPLLVCTPSGAGPASRPALYFIHGGGFYCSDHRIGLDQILDTAEQLGATLISVGYRLAPEHPYPAQINDAYAGLLWVADHADELGIDPERIIVTGPSAGGGLSAALALYVRDKGGPRLLGQLLTAPCSTTATTAPRPCRWTTSNSSTAATTGSPGARCSATPRAELTCRSTPRPPAPPTS